MQTTSQKPIAKSGICPYCKGQRYILKDCKKISCFHCRGTGQSSAGYSTK